MFIVEKPKLDLSLSNPQEKSSVLEIKMLGFSDAFESRLLNFVAATGSSFQNPPL